MSFLIDGPWLYAIGRTATARVEDERAAAALLAATIGVFYGVSIPLYLDRRWTRPIWRLCRAESGRDWMLNSGVFRFRYKRPGLRTHVLAAALFATYPLWLALGDRHGRRRSRQEAA